MLRDGKKALFVFLLVLAAVLHAADKQAAFSRNFWHPEYRGKQLDYCTFDGKGCGFKIANRYCRLMGYERADQAIKAHNVGLTNYLDRFVSCKGWQCNGFQTIRCVSHLSHNPPKTYHYRYRRFVYPRFDGYRVDWCYDGVKQCGRRTAFSFCRRLGYMAEKQFAIQKGVPATKAIGNQKLCFGNRCNGFTEITCYR